MPGMGSHLVCCSQLQSMAIRPTAPDPSQSTVKCVTAGHGKASFTGFKKALHDIVCWIILLVALMLSLLVSQTLMVYLNRAKKVTKPAEASEEASATPSIELEPIATTAAPTAAPTSATATREAREAREAAAKAKANATLVLLWVVSILAFATTLIITLIIVICYYFDQECHLNRAEYLKEDCYFVTFCISVFVILGLSCWCYKKNCCNVQCWQNVIVHPSLFIAFHHLLWVLLGIITEPFWAIPVLVAVSSVLFVLYFLVYEYYLGMDGKFTYTKELWFFVSCFLGFLLLILILVVVGQAFFSDSLIANVAQSIMMLLLPYGVSLLHLENRNKQ